MVVQRHLSHLVNSKERILPHKANIDLFHSSNPIKSVGKVVNSMSCRESRCRSIAKAVSWRVTGSIVTMGLAWAMTGESRTAAAIGLGDTIIKLCLFYAHERVWDRINFGRFFKEPDYEI